MTSAGHSCTLRVLIHPQPHTPDIGVVIAAASRRVARPITRLGDLSLIQRLTLTFQKAGVERIVVITGCEEPEIKAMLMNEGVVFVQLPDSEDPELIESFRIGLRYLDGACRRVFLTPVNTPLYAYTTVEAMLSAPEAGIVLPTRDGKAGHPVLIDKTLTRPVFDYRGPDGLAGFIRTCDAQQQRVEVEDEGILYSVRQMDELQRLLPTHDETLIQPWYDLGIRKAGLVFDSRTLLLLELIDEVHSVSGASKRMSLSLTRSWRMINNLEEQMGVQVVLRSHGGRQGGRTLLSPEGQVLVAAYDRYRQQVSETVRLGFSEFWSEVAPLRDMSQPNAELGS